MRKRQKIIVVFDAEPIARGNITGVGRTTQGLVLALAKQYPNDIELVGHYFDFLSKKKDTDLPSAPNIRYRRTILIPGRVLNMLRRLGLWIPFELLAKERGDFHLFPGFLGWPSLFNTPSAPFVHDITYIDYPQYVNGPAQFDLKTIMPRTLKRASFVIVNSESSKNGLCREYDLGSKPILIEHIPPVDTIIISNKEAAERLTKLGVTGKFLLFFGTIEPRKNLVGLLRAYSLLSTKLQKEYSLVLAGGKGWRDDEIIKQIKELKESGANVIQTGYVSDEDRAALYMKTSAYLLPSHYEGFGMQLLECMVYKTPMIISDIPVLHEVAQNAALYCKTDAKDIAAKAEHLLNDKILQKKLVIEGQKRLEDFAWPKVAQEVYSQIQTSLNQEEVG